MRITLTLTNGMRADMGLTDAEVKMMEETARGVREMTGYRGYDLAQALLFSALRRGLETIEKESRAAATAGDSDTKEN